MSSGGRMLANYHMHTNFSYDSSYPMEDCVKRAIQVGLNEICFTEHMDYGTETSFWCDIPSYREEFLRCQEKYKNQITMKFGIEFGAQAHHKVYFDNIFNKYPFDFALLSFHQVEDKELWNGDFQFGKTQAEYNRIYFEEMNKTIRVFNGFSVLAHMDLMRRYDACGEYPFEKSKEQIEEILKYIISHGKGIEVNTSSYKYKLNDLMPSRDILKFYKELGGEIITVGSDCHREAYVDDHLREVREILKTMGYKYFTTFDKMKPIFNEL